MAIYIFLLIEIVCLGILFCQYKNSKTSHIYFTVISFISFFVVQACRASSVGIDTVGYIGIFYRTKDLPFSEYIYTDLEWGYLFLNKIVGFFTNNPQWLLAVVSAIICTGIAIFIYQNSTNPFWPTFLFLTMNYFFTSIVSLRQYIAIAIVINTFQLCRKKKHLPFILLAILAALFHTSAIFGAICIFMSTLWTPKRKTLLTCIGVAAAGYLLLPQIINVVLILVPKYQYYVNTDLFRADTIGELTTIIILFEVVAVFLVWFFNIKKDKDLFSFTIMIVIAIAVNLMKTQITLLWRLGYYPDIFLIVFIPKLLHRLSGKKIIYYLGLFVFGCALYFYFIKMDASYNVPYMAFWNA